MRQGERAGRSRQVCPSLDLPDPPVFMPERTQVAKKTASSSTVGPSTPVTPTASAASVKMNDNRSAKSDGVKIDYSGDKTRDKCAELVYDALVFDSGARTSCRHPCLLRSLIFCCS